MPVQETIYKIFIASPSGLNDERKAFFNVIEEYNESDAIHRGVNFRAVRWENALPGMGRPQALINEDLKECDFFLLLLHNRWGSNPGKNEQNAISGTEEEFRLAMECYKDENSHMKQIVCAFKSISAEQLADPGKQVQKVIDFKKELEEGKELLYASFFSEQEFQYIIRKQLGRWLLNHENDSEGNKKIQADSPIVPEETIHVESENIEESVSNKDTEEIIKNAQKLANEGKLIDAEIEFSKAVIYSPSNYELLNYTWFLMGIGQLDKALMMLDKVLEDEKNKIDSINIAIAYSCKGIIHRTRGNLNGAEVMHKKSLEIEEQLGRKKGMASEYGNLGNVMNTLGNIGDAEEMYKKSLEINEQLGDKGGMAAQYGNLGLVLRIRGDLNGAEEMYKKSLEINEQLGDKVGLANQYGNLGVVMDIRGDLEDAEEMYKKSLEIDKYLGRKQGIAANYGDLGNVMKSRGDFDKAEIMYKKSIEINEQLGRKVGMATQYGNLGVTMQIRGDLDGAELMYKKSLEIAKAQGFAKNIQITTQNLKVLKEKRKKKNL